tara:strand:- start:113 stop:661 length:549 start_codon:yes stop_codon:yes gene_type:complete
MIDIIINNQIFITWYFIISGWEFIRKNAHFISAKTEARGLLDSILGLTNEIEDATQLIFDNPSKELLKRRGALKIQSKLTHLGIALNQVSQRNEKFSAADEMNALRKILGADFLYGSQPDTDKESSLIAFSTDLRQALDNLSKTLEKQYRDSYKHPFGQSGYKEALLWPISILKAMQKWLEN